MEKEVPKEFVNLQKDWWRAAVGLRVLHYTLGGGAIIASLLAASIPTWARWAAVSAAICSGLLTLAKIDRKAEAFERAHRRINIAIKNYRYGNAVDYQEMLVANKEGLMIIEGVDVAQEKRGRLSDSSRLSKPQ
jgi:hypothetical protein